MWDFLLDLLSIVFLGGEPGPLNNAEVHISPALQDDQSERDEELFPAADELDADERDDDVHAVASDVLH